jgi:hypothetical protein
MGFATPAISHPALHPTPATLHDSRSASHETRPSPKLLCAGYPVPAPRDADRHPPQPPNPPPDKQSLKYNLQTDVACEIYNRPSVLYANTAKASVRHQSYSCAMRFAACFRVFVCCSVLSCKQPHPHPSPPLEGEGMDFPVSLLEGGESIFPLSLLEGENRFAFYPPRLIPLP